MKISLTVSHIVTLPTLLRSLNRRIAPQQAHMGTIEVLIRHSSLKLPVR